LFFADWDNRSDPPTLVGLRDPVEHARRRKPWNRGFTRDALVEYEWIVVKRCRQLIDCLGKQVRSKGKDRKSAKVDMGAWFSYFASVFANVPISPLTSFFFCRTDFMGDIACVLEFLSTVID
jgi:hypothetical protein